MSYMPKSKSDVHITPDRVYSMIRDKWGYIKEEMFDPCPINPKWDGLKIQWDELNYINPPYTLLKEFVNTAITWFDYAGKKSIMLLPAKTDQQSFHDLKRWWPNIIWIRRRLKFANNKHHATQPHFLIKIE